MCEIAFLTGKRGQRPFRDGDCCGTEAPGNLVCCGKCNGHSGDTAEFEPREQFLKPAGRGHTGLLQEMERERSAFSDRTAGQSRPRMEMLHAGPGWLLNRDRRVFADVAASRAGGRFELFTVGDFPYAGKTCIPRKEFFNAVDGVIRNARENMRK